MAILNPRNDKTNHMSTFPPTMESNNNRLQSKKTSPPHSANKKNVCEISHRTFLFYARGVDGTLITPLSAIAGEQAKPTKKTMARVTQLLDYIASQEDAVLTYQASDMVLVIL